MSKTNTNEDIYIDSWYNRSLPVISLDTPAEWEGEKRMSEKDWKKSVKRDLNKLLHQKELEVEEKLSKIFDIQLEEALKKRELEVIEEIMKKYDQEIKEAEKDDFRSLAKFLIDMRNFAKETLTDKLKPNKEVKE